MGLDEYRRKRDLRRTPEPSGGKKGRGSPRFVIQKHAARSLHYDFRLESGGVLKSWAVPKGPSTDPREKRLAMPTEDHPLDYIDFEGVIPEGNYGAGSVIVWDTGPYRILSRSAPDAPLEEKLDRGHVTVWLEGQKLRGGYALTRVARGQDERWILVKMKDEEADARRNPVKTQPESVLTGRTNEEVAADRNAKEWR
ncbi:MAG TPA: DNA polymerase ligase N-terminal domain-containing protein [Actinomycetota bacterium]|jgi:DNA ligase D-like protein (predicted 3'-phosphoesterase)|nr:DNA polymerase ligase N-terminal domain-containing protein [Actinomycetota bacterium]